MDDIKIIDYINKGSNNAKTRKELMFETGCNDRKIRRMIEEERKTTPIINIGKGYFIPTIDDVDKLKVFIKQNNSKAISIFETIKSAKAILADFEKGRIR